MLPESKTERVFGSASANNQTGLLEGVIKKTACLRVCLAALEKVFQDNGVFPNETNNDGGQDLLVQILLDCWTC